MRQITRPLLIAVSSSTLLACAGQPPPSSQAHDPIVHGVVDTGHPAVGAIEAPGWLCTGTLIAPRAVLTAAHCVARDATLMQVFFGTDVSEPGDRIPVIAAQVFPEYRPESPGHDVALLALATAATPAPAPLPGDAPGAMPPASLVGAGVTLVGFGATSPMSGRAGRKRKTVSTVISSSLLEFAYGGTPGQTCDGDSGGPAFWQSGATEVLVGVTSRGDPSCAELGIDTRVDAYLDGFIRPFLHTLEAFPEAPPDASVTHPPDASGSDTAPGACGDITEIGVCVDNVLVYCDDESLVTIDCGTTACDYDPLFGWYDCLE